MIKAKALFPPPQPKPKTPMCEGMVKYTSWQVYNNNDGKTTGKCKSHSSYVIGEKYFCSRHAQTEALRILLEGDENE